MVNIKVDNAQIAIVYTRDGNKLTYYTGTQIKSEDGYVIVIRKDLTFDYIPDSNIGYIRLLSKEKETEENPWLS